MKMKLLEIIQIKVTHKKLDWITEQSGFDWLYDYDFNSPRVLTIKSFVTNCDDPTEEFKAFCEKLLALISWKPKGTFIMFQPPRRRK
jgi:hypothetical protein